MNLLAHYVAATQGLVAMSGMTHAAVHVHAGLLIYFAAQLVLRDRRASALGLAWTAFAEFLNELIEALFYGAFRWQDTAGDVVATLFWPAAIVAVGRYRRRRWPYGEADSPAYPETVPAAPSVMG